MRSPKVIYHRKSYRVIEAGGTDSAGNFRGVNIEKSSSKGWKFLKFKTDRDEAKRAVDRAVIEGVSVR